MAWWRRSNRSHAPEARFRSELDFHLNELINANLTAGDSLEEARRKALIDFGGREQIKEELRDVHRLPLIDATITNLKLAFRSMRRSPSFAVVVVTMLALGIGVNTAVFSAIDAVILRPLPYPHAEQLVVLKEYKTKLKTPESFVAPTRLEDWNAMNSTFQSITGYYTESVTDRSGQLPEKITRAHIAPRFLQTLGVMPALGRNFSSREEDAGGPALISDRYWRRAFHANPTAVGKSIRVDNASILVVGVLPASFQFPADVDLWSPVSPTSKYAKARGNTWYTAIGRMKPGITQQQAQANLAVVQKQLGRQYPQTDADMTVSMKPLKIVTVKGSGKSLWLLWASVTLLLLIACVNISSLLLARTLQRRRELSIRLSLGASRQSIIAQLVTEVAALVLIGSAAAILVAIAGIRIFQTLAKSLPRVEEIHFNWPILAYTLVCSVLVTLVCGLTPALQAMNVRLSGGLSSGGRSQVSVRSPWQWILAGMQIALAVTLLIGAALFGRTFYNLNSTSLGFDPSHILTFHVNGSYAETVNRDALNARIKRSLDGLGALPGVQAIATATELPGMSSSFETEFSISDVHSQQDRRFAAVHRFVSAGYFFALQVPLRRGEFCRQDSKNPTVIVNQKFADTYVAGSDPIGKTLRFTEFQGPESPQIRGIVSDIRESGAASEPRPTVYSCVITPGAPDPVYLLRTVGDPASFARAVRMKMGELEPGRAVYNIAPLKGLIGDSKAEERLRSLLLSCFAITAVALACIGLYGTLTYILMTRKREIGLRLALGAGRRRVLQQIVGQAFRAAAIGGFAGLCLAAAFTHLLAGMLFGVSTGDPVAFGGAIAVVIALALAAAALPALRASRIDPAEVLRED